MDRNIDITIGHNFKIESVNLNFLKTRVYSGIFFFTQTKCLGEKIGAKKL